MITIIQQKQIWQARFFRKSALWGCLIGRPKIPWANEVSINKKGTTQTLPLLAR